MPKPTKYYEKLREKKRLAHEHAKKVQEERKRAREVKEEKWTVRNENELVAEHRRMQREDNIQRMRKEGFAKLENLVAIENARKEREELLDKEIADEIQSLKDIVEAQCAYYDDIVKQVSPPEEKSVDEIVETIRKELKEIYDIYSQVSHFDPKMPEVSGNKQGEEMFAKEIAQMESDIREFTLEANRVDEQIVEVKKQIEEENVRQAAKEQERAMEVLQLEKQVKALEAKLAFVQRDPEEKKEIEKLKQRIVEETEIQNEWAEALLKIKEFIAKEDEKDEKRKKLRKERTKMVAQESTVRPGTSTSRPPFKNF